MSDCRLREAMHLQHRVHADQLRQPETVKNSSLQHLTMPISSTRSRARGSSDRLVCTMGKPQVTSIRLGKMYRCTNSCGHCHWAAVCMDYKVKPSNDKSTAIILGLEPSIHAA